MTQEELEAGNARLPFGSRKGQPLWMVLDDSPSYIDWMINEGFVKTYKSFYPKFKLYVNSDSVQRKLNNRICDDED